MNKLYYHSLNNIPAIIRLFRFVLLKMKETNKREAKHYAKVMALSVTVILFTTLANTTLAQYPGQLDLTFNPLGGATQAVRASAIQPDGKIMVGGNFLSFNGVSSYNRIVRLNTNGTPDTTFKPGTGFNGDVTSIVVQPDSKIIVGGVFSSYNGVSRNGIIRLNSDGTPDATFDPGTGFDGYVFTLALQQDGKILVAGQYSTFNGVSRSNLARLNTDGTLDTAFVPGFNYKNFALALQPDGKIIVGGAFNVCNGIPRSCIARLNIDGTIDTTFDPGTGFNANLNALALRPDGKVIAGGAFITFNGVSRNYIACLNADGTLDTTFDPGTGFNNTVHALATQPDGKVIVGGWFTSFNGLQNNYFIRLNMDGSKDTGFDTGTGVHSPIFTITKQPDEKKAIIGGMFFAYNSIVRYGVARIYIANAGIAINSLNPANNICAGEEITINYTCSGFTPVGNINAELSDSSGSFALPLVIGTDTGAVSGSISVTIPGNIPAGTKYRIRLVSIAPAVTGSNNGMDIIINSPQTVSVNISTPSSGVICAGSVVSFTAVPANGGSNPFYQWKINNADAGNDTSVYSSSSLNDGDVITCVMISNASCVTGSPAVSNADTMNITASLPASVTVNPAAIAICSGAMAEFTAVPDNGGNHPSYQWKVNNTNTGSDTSVYSSDSLNDGDVITCVMTSNADCVAGSPAVTSGSVSVVVNIMGNAGTITAAKDTICATTPAVLNVSSTSGNIQWQSSASPSGPFTDVSGETNSSYVFIPAQTAFFRVKAGNGNCSDTSLVPYEIVVQPSPNAGFTYTVTDKTVNFTNTSADATTYLWHFGDGQTSTEENPSHTYASLSDWHVCLDAANGSNCSFTTCIDVWMTGISSVKEQQQWAIFPNPVTDNIIIRTQSGNLNIESVTVTDLLGRKMIDKNINAVGSPQVIINAQSLPRGMYILKINARNTLFTQSIIKL